MPCLSPLQSAVLQRACQHEWLGADLALCAEGCFPLLTTTAAGGVMSIRGRQERMDFVDTYTVGEALH